MLDRFTVEARKIVASAVSLARTRGAERVGSEHLFLAVCEADGEVGDVLRDLGVDPERMRERLPDRPPAVPPTEDPREPLGPDELADLTRRLRQQGMPKERVRELVERIQRERIGALELGEQAKRVVEGAILAAGKERAGIGHLLGALLARPTEEIEEALGVCGLSVEDVRAAIGTGETQEGD